MTPIQHRFETRVDLADRSGRQLRSLRSDSELLEPANPPRQQQQKSRLLILMKMCLGVKRAGRPSHWNLRGRLFAGCHRVRSSSRMTARSHDFELMTRSGWMDLAGIRLEQSNIKHPDHCLQGRYCVDDGV